MDVSRVPADPNPTVSPEDYYILIKQVPAPDEPTGFTLKVDANLENEDQGVTLLLLACQALTGVSPDLYAKEIEMVRRAAASQRATEIGRELSDPNA